MPNKYAGKVYTLSFIGLILSQVSIIKPLFISILYLDNTLKLLFGFVGASPFLISIGTILLLST